MSEGDRGRDSTRARAVDALASPVLVGRDTELAVLTDCIGSPPAVAVVEGEAGVGKTRLITEVLAFAHPPGGLALVG